MRNRERKEKDRSYVIQKNTGMKLLRAALWTMLVFFFLKGVIITARPQETREIAGMIKSFKTEFQGYKDSGEEIMGFAQNFAKEYLTYEAKGEADYKKRVGAYTSGDFFTAAEATGLRGNARAVYVEAYRKEEYSPTQFDVYVNAEIQYELEETQEGKSLPASGSMAANDTTANGTADNSTAAGNPVSGNAAGGNTAGGSTVNGNAPTGKGKKLETGQTILKVPVSVKQGRYIVEGLPAFVTDDVKDSGYAKQEYKGTPLPEEEAAELETSLSNFLTAYYGQEQSVISYYLWADADKEKFTGLKGRYRFEKIEALKCYQEEGSEDVVCILKYKITDDMNQQSLMQQVNVEARKEKGKYYIRDMNIRTGNLNIVLQATENADSQEAETTSQQGTEAASQQGTDTAGQQGTNTASQQGTESVSQQGTDAVSPQETENTSQSESENENQEGNENGK